MAKKEDTPAKRAVLGEWDVWAAKHSHAGGHSCWWDGFFHLPAKGAPRSSSRFQILPRRSMASRPRMATAGAARQRVVAGASAAGAEPSPAVLWMELGPVRATTLGGAFSLGLGASCGTPQQVTQKKAPLSDGAKIQFTGAIAA